MKRYLLGMLYSGLLIGTVLAATAGLAAVADTCGGASEPPFLAYGINSNLLMMLDNSGSMLDMGYVDAATECFDDSFSPCDPANPDAICHAGNFDLTDPATGLPAWYKWVEKTPPWQHIAYTAGDMVYFDGSLFRALTSGTSIGATIYKDTAVTWEPILRPGWKASNSYHQHSFVFDLLRGIVMYTATGGAGTAATSYLTDPRFLPPKGYQVEPWKAGTAYAAGRYVLGDDLKLYQAKKGGTSAPDATKVTNDSDMEWLEADYFGWQEGISYRSGDIATTDGMIFECLVDHPSSGNTLYDDKFSDYWQRLDEGYFDQVSELDARAFCKDAAGNNFFASGDTCATTSNPGTSSSPTILKAFAASGNFLNWATASKLDIQKDILTGGKFNSDAQRIIGESRGCAGTSFIKQAPIQQLAPATATPNMQLTMKIRMGNKNDRIDSVDDTTRFEIYAITQNGLDFDPCQEAINFFQDPLGVSQVEQNTALCVGFSGTGTVPVEHTVYHKAMQACWYLSKQDKWKGGNDHLLVADNCEDIYLGNTVSQEQIFPANIGIDESDYVCYGVYSTSLPPDREGFIGRCWRPGDYVANPLDTCKQVSCGYGDWDNDPATPSCTNKVGSGLPCFFPGTDGSMRRCDSTGYVDRCSGNFNTGQEKCNTAWDDIYRDPALGGGRFTTNCTPGAVQDIGFWEADWLGDKDTTVDNGAETSTWETCVDQALRDFCKGLEFPEVIDPSDQASSTEETWNLPGILVDAAIVGQLGEKPMLVTKGYIMATAGPKGILQESAQDLRIGAMAFNVSGSGTECAERVPPVSNFCPKGNKDGARIITPIRLGSVLTEDVDNSGTYDPGDRIHVDDLVDAINDVRAISWTPLAEAMYTAIGYYTQNTEVRLDNEDQEKEKDFQTDADVFAVWVNNQAYAPGSYILVGTKLYQTTLGGTSSGTSPIDDSGVKWTEVGAYKGAWTNGTMYDRYNIVKDPSANKLYITYTGGTAVLKAQAPETGGPLFDRAINWEPLLDPVARWCQENHVLLITEGASTADVNPDVEAFTAGSHAFNSVAIMDDGVLDNPVATQCTNGLKGSTYLDDLTYFGHNPKDEFRVYPDGSNPDVPKNDTLPSGDYPFTQKDKKNITTHIVVSGSLRDADIGDDPLECNPVTLMTKAAANGGTTDYLLGENPTELRRQLLEVFSELRKRASAGSAASVISSARGGEGAIYQAIFWPQLTRKDATGVDRSIAWIGDVHGLFLDSRGFMYEDTNNDRTLRPYEDIDGDGKVDQNEALGEDIDLDGHFDTVDEDVDGDGHLDVDEDTNANGTLDTGEDIDLDGRLDVKEDLDNDGRLDTGEDVNHNGSLEANEDLNGNGTMQRTEDLNGDGLFAPFLDIDGDGHRDIEEQLSYPGYTADRTAPDGDDKRVIIYFDDDLGRSLACYDTSIYTKGVCAAPVELTAVNFLWSVNEWLADPALVTSTNRGTYLSNEKKRYIFTWNDLDNDGVVDSGETLPLDDSVDWDSWADLSAYERGSAANDFDMVNNTEVQKYVSWLRGEDIFPPSEDLNKNGILDPAEDVNGNGILDLAMRSRTIPTSDGSSSSMVWRLGDIIHSTPMTVAAPAEGYHLIYNDFSYAQFLGKYKGRRHVVYFGANDGMLHAVNAGFYSEIDKKFCLVPLDGNGKCPTNDDAGAPPALGSELWAYTPYNLLPHLKSLAAPNYAHEYYVDQRPRIFDVQIFQEEVACRTADNKPAFNTAGCIHPSGWGTILVGGMRFGGFPIMATEMNGVPTDLRKFTSSWFIMDITNPEEPPALLGELTSTTDGSTVNLGYTVGMPTMAIMKDKDDNVADKDFKTKWYLILGSGPVDVDHVDGKPTGWALRGTSDQPAKISVLPLHWLIPGSSSGQQPLRISPLDPSVTGAEGGTYTLNSANAFVSDMITVDFDINPSYEEYKSDVIYFGTVEGDFSTLADGTTYWNGGGKLYRLVNKNLNGAIPWGGSGSTYGRGTEELATVPSQWRTSVLVDLSTATGNSQPITAAPSVGTDGHNFWVYFGTGRFYDAYDKTDDTQHSYYGIKEPAVEVKEGLKITKMLTWDQVELAPTGGVYPGEKGLWKVDDILVGQSYRIQDSILSCRSGTPCLPPTLQAPTLYYLDRFIGGTGLDRYEGGTKISPKSPDNTVEDPCATNGCMDGWYRDFYPYDNRERNVGQATLLGGLVTYTTYQPFNDVCQAEGNAYLYGLYYRTGTAWHKNIFGDAGVEGTNITDKLDLGRGLATTPNLHVGGESDPDSKEGPKAFVQTSTGEIKEVQTDNLPVENYRTGRSKWRQCN